MLFCYGKAMLYQGLRSEIGETAAASTDMQAIARIFDLLFHVVEELAPKFQVIVLEHANLDDPRYQEALAEASWVNGQKCRWWSLAR
jgi:hypothetical protein